ncbi:uncharacterized protein LOC128032072 isoform X1 [Gossypium raimondii]|uniref:uncharacterized protein LOC128032072 isoform X1 n=1 Tax=Gossypium raimondii TaxID=29730 RepID=UPI00227C7DB5|nr:uncharacterized protein LOC128032072 isoform X1 [Gossypium raimondii]
MSRTGKGSTSQTTESRDGFHSKEATKRLESIFKKQPMLPDKGFDLKNIDLTMVLSKIQKAVNALKWNMLCTKRQLYEAELVREFYLNLTSSTKTEVPVRGKKILSLIHGCQLQKPSEMNSSHQIEELNSQRVVAKWKQFQIARILPNK